MRRPHVTPLVTRSKHNLNFGVGASAPTVTYIASPLAGGVFIMVEDDDAKQRDVSEGWGVALVGRRARGQCR